MQTNENLLSMMAESPALRGLSAITVKQYLRFARTFLEWSNRNADEIKEEDIGKYLFYLTNTQKLSASTVGARSTAIRLIFGTITGDTTLCPRPRRRLVKNGFLKDDRIFFTQYLLDLGYAKTSPKNYKWTIRCLDQFMSETGKSEYSAIVGNEFLAEAAESGRHTRSTLEMMRYVVRRFTCFKENGEYILVMPRNSEECPSQFAEGLTGYLDFLKLRGVRESTIEQKRYNIQKALAKFDDAEIKDFSEIKVETIYDAFEKTSDKPSFCSPLRGFLRYLFETGVIKFDYSAFVPSVRKAHPIPSVYTSAETEKLLENVEASAKSGKRNNAIILLALRLGMRSGDISNLKISDVDFESKTIDFIQKKTRVPQHLELLPDIEDALLSYISTARPVSDLQNVFLSLKPPFRAITTRTIYSLISRRFETSGIDTGERKRGGHALRMTLASELVAEKVPYDAVRKILGHEDPVSIKHYVGFDIESLRSCAIEIPAVTGKLAAYMEMRMGGAPQ